MIKFELFRILLSCGHIPPPVSGYYSLTGLVTSIKPLQAECYRDLTDLVIYGGVIWGFDKSNDWFIDSHGVETPDYWWRLRYRVDSGTYDAWLMANSATSDRNQMKRFTIGEMRWFNWHLISVSILRRASSDSLC